MIKKILITGGMGNLGSWLTHHFCSLNYDVTVLTKRVRKLEFEQNFKLISCDISSLEDCRNKLVDQYDIIIHTASVNDGFVPSYFQKSLMVNTLGTRNLLEVLKDRFSGHFIYFSTFQVYGKYDGVITEESPINPKNDYANTHLFSEFYLSQFGDSFKYSIIRLTNSYGCPKDYNSSKWYLILNSLSKSAFEHQKIILKSNGQAVRDFIWMQEVCEITEKLCFLNAKNEIFNLSGQKSFSMLDIANFVKNAYEGVFKKSIEIVINNEDKTKPFNLSVKSEKIRNLLAFYKVQEKFQEEAVNIFGLLKKHKKT